MVTSLWAFTHFDANFTYTWNFKSTWVFLVNSRCPQWNVLLLLLKKQCRSICFVSIKLALIKSYHLRMGNRMLLWSWKLPQRNRHVNGTSFESGLRSQGWPQWDCHVNGQLFQAVWGFKPVWLHFGSHVNVLSNCDNHNVPELVF